MALQPFKPKLAAVGSEPTDEALWFAYRGGDTRAFEQLLKRFEIPLYQFISRFLPISENAEEVFQEVFYRALRFQDSYTPQAKFKTWIYTIARNYCIDLVRKKKNRPQSYLEDLADVESDASWENFIEEEGQVNAEGFVNARQIEQRMQKVLEHINPDQKEVFLMREHLGLSFEEIADQVGTSINTVKSRMRYALLSLQDSLKKIGITKL